MSLCSEVEPAKPVESNVTQEQKGREAEVITRDIEQIQYPVHYRGLTQNMKNTTNYEWVIESFVNTIMAVKVLCTDEFVVRPFQESKVYLELELKEISQSKPVFGQPSQKPTRTDYDAENTAEPLCKSPRQILTPERRHSVHNQNKDKVFLASKYPAPYTFPNENILDIGTPYTGCACNSNLPNSCLNIMPCSSQQDVNLTSTKTSISMKSRYSGKYLTFYLINLTTDNSPSWIAMKVTTINACGKEICSKFLQESNSAKYSKMGFDRYLDLDAIKAEDLANDTVTIQCEIDCYYNKTVQQICNIPHVSRDVTDTINKIIDERGLKDPDFTFCCEGKEIRLHKSALVAQSTEMAQIFEDQSLEKMVGIKNIEADYETMLEMVRFIYTGKVENLNQLAPKLLSVAEKYKLKSLKVLCEKNLYDNLTIENAAEILLLADEHKAEDLEREVLLFIMKNVCVVINTDGYKNIESTSKVPSKILRMMAGNKS